ncbi:hypothetical protein Trydic_g11896, partial [Trypoxylus dichotomus]
CKPGQTKWVKCNFCTCARLFGHYIWRCSQKNCNAIG